MKSFPRLVTPLLASLALTAPVASVASAEPGPQSVTRSHGSHVSVFHADSVTVTGTAPAGASSLTLRWVGVARGASRTPAPAVRARTESADRITYDRGEVREVYELRPEGLKQSFVFATLPRGAGDLTVEMEARTDLPLRRASAGEIRFGDDAPGGLRIGSVLGIDAEGLRAKGSLAWKDGRVQMSLPAAFVDEAALPLVLDPLIGQASIIASGTSLPWVVDPIHDVAYLPTSDVYYTTFVRTFNGIESYAAVNGRLLSGTGLPLGLERTISDPLLGQTSHYDARVAGVAGADSFLVVTANESRGGAWYDTHMVMVDSSGSVRWGPYLGGGSTSIDVGGEASTGFDDAIVALGGWSALALYRFDFTTESVLESFIIPAGTSGFVEVALSATGGVTGTYLLVWIQQGLEGDLWGAIIDRELEILVPAFPISLGASHDDSPEVDGDGRHWVVAFERRTNGNGDIHCLEVAYDPVSGSVTVSPERVVASHPLLDQRDPSVAWMGESYLIGFSEQWEGADYDVYVTSLESLDCLDCEGRSAVAYTPYVDRPVRLASQRAAGGSKDEALVTFAQVDGSTTANGELWNFDYAQRFLAQDGSVVDLGGGCGPAGSAHATCALSGTPNFGVGLRGAAPLTPAILALGTKSLGLGCGPCSFVPDPLFLLRTTTDAQGAAGQSLPLPATIVLPGLEILGQWIVRASGPCATVGSSLSNALEITVE